MLECLNCWLIVIDVFERPLRLLLFFLNRLGLLGAELGSENRWSWRLLHKVELWMQVCLVLGINIYKVFRLSLHLFHNINARHFFFALITLRPCWLHLITRWVFKINQHAKFFIILGWKNILWLLIKTFKEMILHVFTLSNFGFTKLPIIYFLFFLNINLVLLVSRAQDTVSKKQLLWIVPRMFIAQYNSVEPRFTRNVVKLAWHCRINQS